MNETHGRVVVYKILLVCAFVLFMVSTLALAGVVTGIGWPVALSLVPGGLAAWALAHMVRDL